MEERRPNAGLHLLDGVALDAHHLLRSLRRSPGFAAAVVLTLALGIGVTTAVVSVADHVLLRSLPFRDPGRLMMMLEADDHGGYRLPSNPTVADWRRDPGVVQALEGVTYIRGDGVTLRVGEETEAVVGGFVGPDFFSLIGARPQLGRVLVADDHRDAAQVAVMSYRLWQRRFSGDPSIVGRRISLDSIPTTVVGVLPVGAVYPGFADIWQPISLYRHQEILQQRGFHADSRTIARLRPGVDSTRAAALMRGVGVRLGVSYPAEQAHWLPALRPVRDEIVGGVGPLLWTLAVAAGAVLVLACANVAGLLLARVAARTRELSLRSAIGASRGRLVRQLLTESLILSGGGGTIGVALALWTVHLSKTFLSTRLPRMDEMKVDWRVLCVAAGATVLTALVCGVWPAFRATRVAGADSLRASALGSVGGRGESRVRQGLVTVQFAVALVLLVGTGLLVQSFRRAAKVNIGFDPVGVLTLRIRPPAGVYSTPEQAAALYARLMDAARTVPGVIDAGFINHTPYSPSSMITTLSIEGRARLDSSNQILYRTVSSSYLRTMKMSVASGRWFDDNDIRAPGGSFIINETMAKMFWPGAKALGQRITVTRASQGRKDFGQPLPGTIVGIVADVHQTRQDVAADPEIYVPYTLETWPWGMLIVRAQNGARAIPALTRAIRSVDSRLIADGAPGAKDFGILEDIVANSLEQRTLSIRLIGAFAACALLLASIGMYGVIAYGITQRTREIGVRKALGATNGAIASLIFREAGVIVTIGALVGAAGVWGGGRLIRSLLFNTSITDVAAYAVAVALLTCVALIATYLPARRAAALDPATALRGE
jgi:putative ABC transport system permease protein